MNNKSVIFVIVIAVLGYVGLNAFYSVDETMQAVVTRFQKIERVEKEAGLKFKIPFLDHVIFYPKNLQQWDGDPGQIPTADKTYIYVDTFARWKIVDPELFFKTINILPMAKSRLNEIIDPAVRNLITRNSLIEAVRKSNRELDTFEIGIDDFADIKEDDKSTRVTYTVELGREKITQKIQAQAAPELIQFGIELVDVKIKRINYVEEVRKTVYDRMIAERKQIAEKFRSEGKGEAQKILGDKERDLKRITSEAYKTAQEIKGKADAEVTRIFAEAYSIDPEFYSFVKTLEIYNQSLDKNSSIILSTDSEFFKYLKGYHGNP